MRRIAHVLIFVTIFAAGCASEGGDDDDDVGGGPDAAVEEVAPDAGAEAACTAGTPYMETCATDDECDTCLCFHYNMGDTRCTHECTVDADCAAPSTGCSGMGVCKRPQG